MQGMGAQSGRASPSMIFEFPTWISACMIEPSGIWMHSVNSFSMALAVNSRNAEMSGTIM